MTAPRLVVFDVDGTLIDSQHLIIAAMRRAVATNGLPQPDDAAILGIVGLSLNEAIAALIPSLPPARVVQVAKDYAQAFVAQRKEMGGEGSAPMYPGARAALDRLKARAGVLMGVATGKARRGLDHALAVHDLTRYFVTAQCADDHPSKPHPSMLLRALAETGRGTQGAVMIGDTEFDIAMGRAAGYATIAVAWGYHPRPRLAAAGADIILDDFDGLDDALHQIWGR